MNEMEILDNKADMSNQNDGENIQKEQIPARTKVYTDSEKVKEILQEMSDQLSYVESEKESIIAIYENEISCPDAETERSTYRIHIYNRSEEETAVFYSGKDTIKPVVELVCKVDSDDMVIGGLSEICVAARGEVIEYKKVVISAETKDENPIITNGYKKEGALITGIIFARVSTLLQMNEHAQAIQQCYPDAMLMVMASPVEEGITEYIEAFLFASRDL